MKTTINTLIQAATDAYVHAYAPYSHFCVGAAVLDEAGSVHTGCNVENAAYPSGSCAEEQAIGSMIAGGGRQIRAILITGLSEQPITPCGACRQRIREFAQSDALIYIHDQRRGILTKYSIDGLLPNSFGPDTLH